VKNHPLLKIFIASLVFFFGTRTSAQNPVNWSAQQLMAPAQLANTIIAKKDLPVIISICPAATIPNSIEIGMINSSEGLTRLKTYLRSVNKDKKVVIYCGCCPLLIEMKYFSRWYQ
jgi:hypothetical protein